MTKEHGAKFSQLVSLSFPLCWMKLQRKLCYFANVSMIKKVNSLFWHCFLNNLNKPVHLSFKGKFCPLPWKSCTINAWPSCNNSAHTASKQSSTSASKCQLQMWGPVHLRQCVLLEQDWGNGTNTVWSFWSPWNLQWPFVQCTPALI